MNMKISRILIVLASIVMFACQDSDNGSNSGSDSTSDASTGNGTLLVQSVLEPGDECPHGGVRIESGIDENGNGVLDEDEVDVMDVICSGEDGTDGADGTDGVDGADGTDGADGADGNSTPVANAGSDQMVVAGMTATIDGSGSDDSDEDELTFSWTLLSRPTESSAALSDGTTASPSLTTDKPGDYVVRLEVNDGLISSSEDTVTITAINPRLVPDTGVETCYNGSGSTIVCPDPDNNLAQDGSYTINPQSFLAYDINGDADGVNDIVSDQVTGLMWQRQDDGNTYTWSEAGDYCSNLQLGGYSDWRLPTAVELTSIVDNGTSDPALKSVFTNPVSSSYWSSTTDANDPDYAWSVLFNNGYVDYYYKSGSQSVRCVRAGSESVIGSFDLLDNGDGTVTDNNTRLMWVKIEDIDGDEDVDSGDDLTWESALNFCENLTLAGYEDWRLPTIKELQTIADYSKTAPAIDKTVFPETVSSFYWSSTTYADNTVHAWRVYFGMGRVTPNDKSLAYYVRCVRAGE